MNSLICDAIDKHLALQFFYKGGIRIVEPFCYGSGTSGKDLLRGYQVDGYCISGNLPAWRLFNVDDITTLSITDRTFVNHPGYRPDDSEITTIYARVV